LESCTWQEREREDKTSTSNLVELLELVELVLRLGLELGAVLAAALELVDKLVDHVPEPLVGQLHVDDAVKDDSEEVAVVGPGLGAVRGSERREAGVGVAVPELAVEEEEDGIAVAVGCDGLRGGPGSVAEEAVGEALEAALVHLVDLVDVLVPDVAVQVHHEGLDGVRHVAGIVSVHRVRRRRRLQTVLPVVGGRRHGWGTGEAGGFNRSRSGGARWDEALLFCLPGSWLGVVSVCVCERDGSFAAACYVGRRVRRGPTYWRLLQVGPACEVHLVGLGWRKPRGKGGPGGCRVAVEASSLPSPTSTEHRPPVQIR
jgi:hypothetical protein